MHVNSHVCVIREAENHRPVLNDQPLLYVEDFYDHAIAPLTSRDISALQAMNVIVMSLMFC